MVTKKQPVSVAKTMEQLFALSPKQQNEIAAEVGYEKPNMLTMIKQGRVKLPINKIGAFAKALNADPTYLLRIAMSEYSPETWAEIEKMMGKNLISDREMDLISLIREASRGVELDFKSNAKLIAAITNAITPFVNAELEERESIVRLTTKRGPSAAPKEVKAK